MIRHYIFEKTINGEAVMCVKAVMNNCGMDVVKLITRATGGNIVDEFMELAIIPNSFERVVVCDPRDKFDPALGMRKADERIMASYNDCCQRAMKRYKNAVDSAYNAIKDVNMGVVALRPEKLEGDWYERKAAELMGK